MRKGGDEGQTACSVATSSTVECELSSPVRRRRGVRSTIVGGSFSPVLNPNKSLASRPTWQLAILFGLAVVILYPVLLQWQDRENLTIRSAALSRNRATSLNERETKTNEQPLLQAQTQRRTATTTAKHELSRRGVASQRKRFAPQQIGEIALSPIGRRDEKGQPVPAASVSQANPSGVEPTNLDSGAATKPKSIDSLIPQRLVFTYQWNILESKQPWYFYQNVQRTIQQYENVWGKENMEVAFLNDTDCVTLLREIKPELAQFYLEEDKGSWKGDICRIAALYQTGGYYLDVDLEVITPYVAKHNRTFVSSYDSTGEAFFQAFLATTPQHPILLRNLNDMIQFYEKGFNGKLGYDNVGCCMGTKLLFNSFRKTSKPSRGKVHLLNEVLFGGTNGTQEEVPSERAVDMPDADKAGGDAKEDRLSHIPLRNLTKATGCCCNYAVHDAREPRAYFYSRIVSDNVACRFAG